jgi:hypothetical protein
MLWRSAKEHSADQDDKTVSHTLYTTTRSHIHTCLCLHVDGRHVGHLCLLHYPYFTHVRQSSIFGLWIRGEDDLRGQTVAKCRKTYVVELASGCIRDVGAPVVTVRRGLQSHTYFDEIDTVCVSTYICWHMRVRILPFPTQTRTSPIEYYLQHHPLMSCIVTRITFVHEWMQMPVNLSNRGLFRDYS